MKKILIGWMLVWCGTAYGGLDDRPYVEKTTKAKLRLTRPVKVTTDTNYIDIKIYKVEGKYTSAAPIKIDIAGEGNGIKHVYFPIRTELRGMASDGISNGKTLISKTEVIDGEAVKIREENNLQIYGIQLKDGKGSISFNQVITLKKSELENQIGNSIEFRSSACGVLVGVRSI